jgi:hypothetical protein
MTFNLYNVERSTKSLCSKKLYSFQQSTSNIDPSACIHKYWKMIAGKVVVVVVVVFKNLYCTTPWKKPVSIACIEHKTKQKNIMKIYLFHIIITLKTSLTLNVYLSFNVSVCCYSDTLYTQKANKH